ncbi:MAG: FG-GAP repeat protein [Candidatus Poribacteria bacterium]|nr:FG-GAP repeat protein [Candidatus Poribacteria bacterium]MDE0505146.1 FG-GAP repeat protein [Candidatus Poribacteria bacterium]
MQTLRTLFVCSLLGIGPVTVTLAEEAKILDINGKLGDAFDYVAISGDTAIVGAKGNDDPVPNGGAAQIFVRSKGEGDWVHHQKLAPPDVNNESQFGKAVAISGKFAIGGALEDDFKFQNAGSAYTYERTGKNWPQREKLIASDAAAGDEFGTSVAISGDTAIVGAPRHDGNKGKDSGSLYSFHEHRPPLERTGNLYRQRCKCG